MPRYFNSTDLTLSKQLLLKLNSKLECKRAFTRSAINVAGITTLRDDQMLRLLQRIEAHPGKWTYGRILSDWANLISSLVRPIRRIFFPPCLVLTALPRVLHEDAIRSRCSTHLQPLRCFRIAAMSDSKATETHHRLKPVGACKLIMHGAISSRPATFDCLFKKKLE